MILLDANILLRLSNNNDPEYRRIQHLVFAYRQTDPLVIAPQSLYEFWAVATRSKEVNGLGLPISSVKQWIAASKRMFPVLLEPAELVQTWISIVAKYTVTGFRAHDARYIALMQIHNITQFMTYNVKHFSQYPITIINPAMNAK